MADENQAEHELFEKLLVYDGTMLLHKAAIMADIDYLVFEVTMRRNHKLADMITVAEGFKEMAARCPHAPCNIRGEV